MCCWMIMFENERAVETRTRWTMNLPGVDTVGDEILAPCVYSPTPRPRQSRTTNPGSSCSGFVTVSQNRTVHENVANYESDSIRVQFRQKHNEQVAHTYF